jgi:SAM-dependent methyltransferase
MKFITKTKFLLNFIYYTTKNLSPCKIYQILEFKKLKIKKETIEFGTSNYKESFFRLSSTKSKNLYFSDIKNKQKPNYIKIDLEKLNFVKKKFDNIIIFNVLEHIYDDRNALHEMSKILKKDGKIYISTPFLYRYHEAPEDYKRYTVTYFEKLLDKNYKIINKEYLGEGPLMASYSLLYDYLKKIPFLAYPVLIVSFILDNIISLFHKTNINKIYPICIFIVAKKK